MPAQGAHKITEMFEAELCRYTGAPYAVAVDSATSALELCLMKELFPGQKVYIPKRTYPSVACAVLLAGAADGLRGVYRAPPGGGVCDTHDGVYQNSH